MTLEHTQDFEMQADYVAESADREKTPEQNMENLFSNTQKCIAEKTKENTQNILFFEKYLQECTILSENSEKFNSWVDKIFAQHLQPLDKQAA